MIWSEEITLWRPLNHRVRCAFGNVFIQQLELSSTERCSLKAEEPIFMSCAYRWSVCCGNLCFIFTTDIRLSFLLWITPLQMQSKKLGVLFFLLPWLCLQVFLELPKPNNFFWQTSLRAKQRRRQARPRYRPFHRGKNIQNKIQKKTTNSQQNTEIEK